MFTSKDFRMRAARRLATGGGSGGSLSFAGIRPWANSVRASSVVLFIVPHRRFHRMGAEASARIKKLLRIKPVHPSNCSIAMRLFITFP
jgi:hypothetical protein